MKNYLIVVGIIICFISCNKNIALLISSSRNKTIIINLKSTTYDIRRPLKLESNTIINGNGAIIINSDNNSVFEINNATNVEIKNLIIQNRKNTNIITKNEFIISINNSNNILLRKISFKNQINTCIHTHDVSNLWIDSCTFLKIGLPTNGVDKYSYDGVFIGGYQKSKNITLTDCSFINIGINDKNVGNYQNDGDGIHVQCANGATIKNIKILKNNFSNCSARGIKLQSGYNILIKENNFSKCGTGIGISMATNVSNIYITDNRFEDNRYVFGTNSIIPLLVDSLYFISNIINKAEYVFRVSGKSSVSNAYFISNEVNDLNLYFVNGIFKNCIINDNIISNFNKSSSESYNKAILLGDKCENIVICNNQFTSMDKKNYGISIKNDYVNLVMERNIYIINKNIDNSKLFYLRE